MLNKNFYTNNINLFRRINYKRATVFWMYKFKYRPHMHGLKIFEILIISSVHIKFGKLLHYASMFKVYKINNLLVIINEIYA